MLKEQQLEKQTERRLEKIITVEGRLVDRPTFKVIRDLLLPLKTITYKEGGRWKRKFIHGTPQRLLKLIQAMGFSPMIYLEPFEPDMDLWNYLTKNQVVKYIFIDTPNYLTAIRHGRNMRYNQYLQDFPLLCQIMLG